MGDVSGPACVRFSPPTRPLIAAPRYEPARHGIQRRRLNALPDRPRAPRAPRPRGSPRSPRRDRRPPRVLVLDAEDAGSAAGRLAAAAKGFTLAAAASVALLAADPACAELNARGAHRPSPWVPSSPRDTHTNRRCPFHQPDNETKHLVPSAHPSPSPSPPRFPQTQRPREAASSTAAAPSSSAATTSPARTSSRNTARTFASPTSRAPRCARRNSGALTSRARTS